MAGGRRRRGNTFSSESVPTRSPLAVVPEDSASIHEDDESGLTAVSNPNMPGLEDTDDPFAYDSDLETLSSVSSHSSISSSSSSVLDHTHDQASDADQQHHAQTDCSEDDDDIEMASAREGGGHDIDDGNEESGDAHDNERYSTTTKDNNNNDRDEASDKTDSDSEGSGDDKVEARYLSTPGIISASASTTALTRQGRASSSSSKRQSKYAAYRLANGEDGDAEDEDGGDSDSQDQCSALDTPETCESNVAKGAGSRSGKRKRPSEIDAESEDNSAPQSGVGEFGEEEEKGVTQGDLDMSEDSVANEARRSEAMIELTGIEVEFARLRERLYSERLQQVQIEEEYLVAGQHMEYERHIEDISAAFVDQMERLQATHEVWLAHRQKMHETRQCSVKYTYLAQRQELRSRMLAMQKKRLWRLRDTRVQDDQRRTERALALRANGSAVDDLIAQQQAIGIRLLKRERRAVMTAQKCLVNMRRQRLAVPGLDADEMDADYLAMNLPVYAREQKGGAFRRLYVPAALTAESDPAAGKKRKPRQPRQPKKKKVDEGFGPPPFPDGTPTGGVDAAVRPAAVSKPAVVPSDQAPPKAVGSGTVTAKQASHAAPAAMTAAARPGPPMGDAGQPRGAATGHAARPGAKTVGRPPPLNLPAPHSLHNAGRVQAVGGVAVSTAQTVVAGGSASSDETGARSSVDMHVPTGNNGPLGLRV
ncbi:hypothetical protein GGI20_002846 [Coemansia sp. BCRC 34301]|nr:hypothetical protein GGI20_002846 [Coemansia sp. BCRC 34301]